jgi:hypothetical protein
MLGSEGQKRAFRIIWNWRVAVEDDEDHLGFNGQQEIYDKKDRVPRYRIKASRNTWSEREICEDDEGQLGYIRDRKEECERLRSEADTKEVKRVCLKR